MMCTLVNRMIPRVSIQRISFIVVLVVAGMLLPILSTSAQGQTGEREPDYVVCETCEISSLSQVLETAEAGALIEVRGGVYPGPILIDRDVQLVGVGNPVIDGQGIGTVLTIRETTAAISGFTVRSTGTSLHREDAAILVDSAQATIQDNHIEDALFGLYVKNSSNTILRNNLVIGKDMPVASRGDGIRVWYCDDVIIEGNIAQDGRDVILWYSDRGIVRDNQFDYGRYGLHLMFSDDSRIEGNSLRGNSIGLYVMYSRNVTVKSNSMSDNHGPSGGGLGLKDVDGAEIVDNRFVNNRIGAQVDTSPREPNLVHHWSGNVFAYNEAALGLMPAVRNNAFTDNSFIDNMENVSILGGGQLRDISWAVDGRGNYWSDYVGYDADGDGIGDIPYRSQQLFESLVDENPQLRLFIFSPAAMAIDFAARAFPAVQPREKLTDPAPLMSPPVTAALPPVEQAATWARAMGVTGGITASLATLLVISRVRRRPGIDPVSSDKDEIDIPMQEITTDAVEAIPVSIPAVHVNSLTKRYGDAVAVDELCFEVAPGEAVAMWGPNGAGKTTILRCLLGIARYSGEIRVHGLDPVEEGRATRATIGFVPQDLAPSAVPVGELAHFIARLKDASEADSHRQLERLGIGDQLKKPVAALSGGMKQRLALALALIGDPKVLLLDEPTANLDAAGRAGLLDLLQQLKHDGLTIIFSSHRPDDVLALADRILMMERGTLVRDVTPEEFGDLLDAGARLIMTLSNGHVADAVTALRSLGYVTEVSGKVLTVGVQAHEKALVLTTLARAGIDIDDFEVERTL
jgi:nitrous oxidase accessory protein